jgi:GntR family transcriptional regulator
MTEAGASTAPPADEPAWAQIEAQLAERIESGGLQAGERLPPERELARSLGVSRMTVRQALGALAERGLVDRGGGAGDVRARSVVAASRARRRGRRGTRGGRGAGGLGSASGSRGGPGGARL